MIFMKTTSKITPLTVSIGIPAYNEEQMISTVVRSLLRQKEEGFVLEKIYVTLDGSTDHTEERVRKIKDSRIVLIKNAKRSGKATRLNELFQKNSSDIFFIIDADVYINDLHFLSKMVKPFADKKIGLVSANNHPIKPRTFFGRIWYAAENFWYEVRKNVNGGSNLYNNSGCSIAIRKELADTISLPRETIADQQFIYIYSVMAHWKFFFQKDAFLYYSPPTTLHDIKIQYARSLGEDSFFHEHFQNRFDDEFVIPPHEKFAGAVSALLKDPIFTPMAILMLKVLGIIIREPHPDTKHGLWPTTSSTKNKIKL